MQTNSTLKRLNLDYDEGHDLAQYQNLNTSTHILHLYKWIFLFVILKNVQEKQNTG